MKIYILYDECEFHRIGYFANKYLAYEGAYDFYKSINHPSPTFDAFWEQCCSFEEVTLVTQTQDKIMPTFRKNNADKPRWSRLARLPGHACLLKAMERNDFGAAQYGDQNWRNGTVDAYLDALMRHALALCGGQIADADDPGAMAHGLEHTDAIVWNALVLSELIAAQQTDNTNKTENSINADDIVISPA